MKQSMSLEEFKEMHDCGFGICLNCGDVLQGIEPDAENYECPICFKHEVYGLDQALLIGQLELTGEDEDEYDEEGN